MLVLQVCWPAASVAEAHAVERIIIYGDSALYNVSDAAQKRLVERISNGTGRPVFVSIVGRIGDRYGASCSDERPRLRNEGTIVGASVVVLALGANDVIETSSELVRDPLCGDRLRASYRRTVQDRIEGLRSPRIILVLAPSLERLPVVIDRQEQAAQAREALNAALRSERGSRVDVANLGSAGDVCIDHFKSVDSIHPDENTRSCFLDALGDTIVEHLQVAR